VRTDISVEEFAALVDTPADELRAWAGLGLLDPAGHGSFDEVDLLRLMTIRHYRELGYEPQQLAEALSRGEVDPFLGSYIYPSARELSLDEAAHQVELEPEMLRALRTALGFSRTTVHEGDLDLFRSLNTMAIAGMPFEAVVEGARVFGDTLRRLAEAEIRLVHVHIHERLEAEGAAEADIVQQIEGLQQAVVPLLDGIVQRVHHEHLLHASIEDAYVHLVDTDAPGSRGSVDATIVFIDVESFTQLAESQGDEAAMEAMTRVGSMVRALTLEHGGKVVKEIGDALMLAFRDAAEAVRFAAEIEQAVRGDEAMPGLHMGLHCGPAIYRGGDYLGATVNLAARVSNQAAAGETLMTQAVAERADDAVPIEPVGVRMLRGVERPLTLYRLTHRDAKRDPICGKLVEAPPAARLQQDDGELWFCSKECLRRYLETEAAA
jgi:adenylate cyclase